MASPWLELDKTFGNDPDYASYKQKYSGKRYTHAQQKNFASHYELSKKSIVPKSKSVVPRAERAIVPEQSMSNLSIQDSQMIKIPHSTLDWFNRKIKKEHEPLVTALNSKFKKYPDHVAIDVNDFFPLLQKIYSPDDQVDYNVLLPQNTFRVDPSFNSWLQNHHDDHTQKLRSTMVGDKATVGDMLDFMHVTQSNGKVFA